MLSKTQRTIAKNIQYLRQQEDAKNSLLYLKAVTGCPHEGHDISTMPETHQLAEWARKEIARAEKSASLS
jgi:hypothetical protein